MKYFSVLAALLFILAGAATAQTQSKLVGWAGYINYFASDSAHYTYTGTNGGDLKHLLKFTGETIYANSIADTFAPYNLVLQSFDANDNITQAITQSWDTTKWVNSRRDVYTYDANNNDTLDVYQLWNDTGWLNSYKYHYGIVNNTIDTIIISNFYPNSWKYTSKEIYTHNVSNDLTSNLYQYWDDEKKIWFTSGQILSYYDAFNNDTADVSEYYDTTAKVWSPSSKYVSDYDAAHHVLATYDLSWSSHWDTSTKTVFYYDANFNDTADFTLQYNSPIDTEQNNFYTYNSYNQETSHIFKGNPAFFFEPYSETYYYYQNFATGVNQLSRNNNQLSIYPNPSNGLIHLTLTLPQMQPVQLSLYTIQGQQVWAADMGNAAKVEATIPVTTLPGGTYIVKVISGNTVQQKEIMVTR